MARRQEITERLRQLVQSFCDGGGVVRSGDLAKRILREIPDCEMSEHEISELALAEAVRQRVAVEMHGQEPPENSN